MTESADVKKDEFSTALPVDGVSRNEEDVLLKKPVEVLLCGETYPIHPLLWKDSPAFRKRCGELFGRAQSLGGVDPGGEKGRARVMEFMVGDLLDDAVELLFAYSPELPREKILESATLIEMTNAITEVFDLFFPFFQAALKAAKKSQIIKST